MAFARGAAPADAAQADRAALVGTAGLLHVVRHAHSEAEDQEVVDELPDVPPLMSLREQPILTPGLAMRRGSFRSTA